MMMTLNKSHPINEKDNFICGWYIDRDICDQLIDYHKKTDKKAPGVFGNRQIDLKVKNSIDCHLEDPNLYNKYYSELQKCVDLYIEKYPWCNYGSPWSTIEPASIQYYPPGGGYFVWHVERQSVEAPNIYRHLVFITYLNDVKDSGETEFLYQDVKIKPEAGLTIIFPADWMFVHRGVASMTEEKYIYTGWFNYFKGG